MKNRPVGANFFQADRERHGRSDKCDEDISRLSQFFAHARKKRQICCLKILRLLELIK